MHDGGAGHAVHWVVERRVPPATAAQVMDALRRAGAQGRVEVLLDGGVRREIGRAHV